MTKGNTKATNVLAPNMARMPADIILVIGHRQTHHQPFWGAATTLESNIDGLVQDCSNSIANAMELLQPCTKPSIQK